MHSPGFLLPPAGQHPPILTRACVHATPLRSLHLLNIRVSALILLALLSLGDCGVRPEASASQRKHCHYDGSIAPVLGSCEVAQGQVGSLHSFVKGEPNQGC